jgi:hypothetical protein
MPRESLLVAVLLVCALASAHGTEPTDTDRDTAHETSSFWSFRRLASQPVPEYRNRQRPLVGAVRNPIDAFILRDLEKHGLTFSRDAQPGSSGSPWVIHSTQVGDVLVGITHGGGRAPQVAFVARWLQQSVATHSSDQLVWASKVQTLKK